MGESLEKLDIRVGKVLAVDEAVGAPKKSYRLRVDFGKYGERVSVARLTQQTPEELIGLTVLAVMNFPPRQVGETLSEVLVLGVQLPKVDSGEATPITTLKNVKIGSKLF